MEQQPATQVTSWNNAHVAAWEGRAVITVGTLGNSVTFEVDHETMTDLMLALTMTEPVVAGLGVDR